ncbi:MULTISPECIES: hypothetical protein [unclassified Pseudomonas]|uniref:hypothetical protein n=1 Tax=unclassified Pseudomonas TaxID=196821 RepID=UPI0009DA8ECC|nr:MULTISPECIES: hypothetical protein [unclassified Pseudomonas]WIE48779.1 hypothetical protein PMI20_024015 [Pseudomonas sp. GM17]
MPPKSLEKSRRLIENGRNKALLCPSAQPEWEGAKIFGVVNGTVAAPEVAYLSQAIPMTKELAESTVPVSPAEVFRISAPCAEMRCQHYKEGGCQLVSRTVEKLKTVTDKLPRCSIRASCRWWNEQGPDACFRCPQVVTNSFSQDEMIIIAATPI